MPGIEWVKARDATKYPQCTEWLHNKELPGPMLIVQREKNPAVFPSF